MRRYYQSFPLLFLRGMCWFVCSKEDDDDWEIREDFSVFICFQNMCLAIYLFSAIKIQYPQAIIITTIRGGAAPATLSCKMSPKGRVWDWDLPSSRLNSTLVRCCWCCCPSSVESSNEFSARLHLKRRALKLRSDSRPRSGTSCSPSFGIELPPEFLKV